jgi:hypothetical protein
MGLTSADSEGRQVSSDEKHPITAGFVALVAVGLGVGLLLGVFTLVVTRVAGLGNDDGTSASGGGPSLYLPTPAPSSSSGAPAGQATAPPSQPSSSAPPKPKGITLQAGQSSVASMQRIDLTGVYPGGEGAVLQVQRMGPDHRWEDFPVTAAVSGETFPTYVQTGRSGVQRFRVRDSDTGRVSNVVPVTVQ